MWPVNGFGYLRNLLSTVFFTRFDEMILASQFMYLEQVHGMLIENVRSLCENRFIYCRNEQNEYWKAIVT